MALRIAFLYTCANEDSDFWPQGLASVMSAARSAGHEVFVFTYVPAKQDIQEICEWILKIKPHVVGFTSVSSQFPIVSSVASVIRDTVGDIIIVCGGTHPTIFPRCILDASALDGIFMGESEDAFVEFLHCIEKKADHRKVSNLGYRSGNEVVLNKTRPLYESLDALPYPEKDLFPGYKKHISSWGVAHFCFSRGCPYQCTYCSNHAIRKAHGGDPIKVRVRSVDSALREINETLARYPNIDKLIFYDEVFGFHRAWLEEFTRKYKEEIGLPFGCQTRPNHVTEDYADLLKEGGCIQVEMGVQSGNEYIRNKIMKRCMSDETIINAFSICNKHGFVMKADFILGVPQETEETIMDSIRLCRNMRPVIPFVNIFYPFPGTELGDYCYEHDLIDFERLRSFESDPKHHYGREGIMGPSVLKWHGDFWEKLNYVKANFILLVDADKSKTPEIVEMELKSENMQKYGMAGHVLTNLPIPIECGDTSEHIVRSRFFVFENGVELGPAHSEHQFIRDRGRGSFSHWYDTLYFSASDNTDPRTNGKKYVLKYKENLLT